MYIPNTRMKITTTTPIKIIILLSSSAALGEMGGEVNVEVKPDVKIVGRYGEIKGALVVVCPNGENRDSRRVDDVYTQNTQSNYR